MVRDFAATLDPDQLDTPRRKLLRRGQDMLRVGIAAERQDGGMLEQEQPVADPAVGALAGKASLERPRLPIRDSAEPLRVERFGTVGGTCGLSVDRGGLHVGTIAGRARRAVGGTVPGRAASDDP